MTMVKKPKNTDTTKEMDLEDDDLDYEDMYYDDDCGASFDIEYTTQD